MNKQYIITFSVCVIVLFSVAAVLLMITLPEQVGVLEGNSEEYQAMAKANYTYKSTKNITTDIIEINYVVTGDQMKDYANKYLYLPGNADPFSPKVTTTEVDETNTSNSNNSNNSNQGNSSTGNTNNTEVNNKVENSNPGSEIPPSTNK